MEYQWQTGEEEVWRKIPGVPEKYEISNKGRIRAWYKYDGHAERLHSKIIRGDGGSVCLPRKKYAISSLMQIVFGVKYCEDIDGEVWIDVRGYEDLYQVSNMGRIRSKPKVITRKNGVNQYFHERIIKFCTINSGYYRVVLHKDLGSKSFLVHRLVATHFLPNPNEYKEVNHKNEKKTDNRVENLEWCDKIYNSLYGTCQQRRIQTRLKNNNGKYGVQRRSTRDASL